MSKGVATLAIPAIVQREFVHVSDDKAIVDKLGIQYVCEEVLGMLKIDTIKQNERISTQDLLLKIEDAVKAGETDFEIASSEQHDIGGSLWHPERKTLKFHATNAGQRVGSMCLPNTEIIVEDSTSADVGWLNAGGIITVKGDTGDTVEHCSSGGKIYIGRRAGTRTGSLMKHDPFYEEPELWAKKNVGRFSFEFMGDGRAVVCVVDSEEFSSVLGDRPCVGMVGGIVYFRGNISDYQKDILYLELDEYGIAFLKGGIFSDVAVNDFQVLRNGKIDDAIKIGELGLKSANIEIEPPQNLTGKKTGIIGGGVAGLSTAWQLRLLGHEVTVYDDAEKIGGKIVYPFLTKKITDEEIFADDGRFIESDQVIVLIG